MKVLLANPRGFCAGVDRAIDIVERAIELFGAPIYVKHEIVHNKFVVNDLIGKGAVFIEELSDVPEGATLIFSAHGVSRAVQDEASERGFQVFDATCPLVTKVHMEVNRYAQQGKEVVLIGHEGHPEVEGTMGQYIARQTGAGGIYLVESVEDVASLEVKSAADLAYVSQTTLSVDDTAAVIDALRAKFPEIHGPQKDDICYATQNRQDAVKSLVQNVDALFVVGSKNSSNSNRLKEIGEVNGVSSYLIDNADEIDPQWLQNANVVGVTAGASAPEILVEQVIEKLKQLGADASEVIGREETIVFSLPKMLRKSAS